jgi:hypothetical protein
MGGPTDAKRKLLGIVRFEDMSPEGQRSSVVETSIKLNKM